MMTLEEIVAAVDELNAHMTDKGWRTPKCEFQFDGQFWFLVRAQHPMDGGLSACEYAAGDTPEKALANARRFIHDLPTGHDAAVSDFRKALGALIDKGNALGIEADFLNPLTEQMRRLSENVITSRVTPHDL